MDDSISQDNKTSLLQSLLPYLFLLTLILLLQLNCWIEHRRESQREMRGKEK